MKGLDLGIIGGRYQYGVLRDGMWGCGLEPWQAVVSTVMKK